MTHESEQWPEERVVDLKEQAERCRRLSRATYDRDTAEMLDRMANDYERRSDPSAIA